MWIQGFHFREDDPGQTEIRGRVFTSLDDIPEQPYESHTFGVVLASSPAPNVTRFKMADVLGKGMALHTDALSGSIDPKAELSPTRKWIVDIVDFETVRRLIRREMC